MADCKLLLREVDELLLVDGLRAAAADTEAGAVGAAEDEEDAGLALAALSSDSALAFASSS